MLVACSLVNLTTWECAEPVFRTIRFLWPTVEDLAGQGDDALVPVLAPLGLQNRRARSIVGMARAWLRDRPTDSRMVIRLPGCGKYAADSWAIFVEGCTDVRPNDGKLNWYVNHQLENA